MAGRIVRSAARLAAAAALALAVGGGTAAAAQVTLQPSPEEARTFATGAAGWTSATSRSGLVCTGLTCPTATPSVQAGGGTGGAGDGFLRAGFGTTLLSLAATATVTWTSPSFPAPAAVDDAALSLALRPDVASLLSVGGTLTVRTRLVDAADGSSTPISTTPVNSGSTSFGTLTVAVPAGALAAGRSYRLAIDVVLVAPAAVLQSGTVDVDDVVLRTTRLEPPRDLTAAVAAAGAPRVTGQVDPAGQTTAVTVQYGPTAAYGSATPPTTVAGSGSQSFAIPLAGLEPGQQYHYRVVAQNADGSTMTDDATFTAPTPPADAPPIVLGAGNSAARTVVFDRAGDVVAATVELLDAGGAVLASYDDPDGDGRVTIALPADGAYSVRVVRENDAAQRTVSEPVAIALDTVPPATAGIGLSVSPPLSPALQRVVSFTPPADAVAATLEVRDAAGRPVGAPVPAGSGTATVALGDADGSYTVRLTVRDAAGNEATVDSEPVTVDRTPPASGPAPAVVGDPDALSVSFTRAPDAVVVAIELLDVDGVVVATVPVPVGAGATVALPAEPSTYGIRVVQIDAAGNVSRTEPTAATRPAPLDGGEGSGGDGGGGSGGPGGDGSGGSGGDGSGGDGSDGSGGSGGDGSGGDGGGGTGGTGGGESGGTGGGESGGTGGGGTGGGESGGTGGGAGAGGGNGAGSGKAGGRSGAGAGGGAADPGRFGALLRSCFGGDLVLSDVTARGRQVTVRGLARLAPGTTVRIVDRAGRVVGRARVAADGRFATRVRAPAAARARLASGYRAVVGRRRSPLVRLRRANALTAVSVRGATITVRGRIDLARLGTLKRLRVYGGAGAMACRRSGELKPVGRPRIDRRSGAYVVRARAPRGSGRLVVRTRAVGTRLTSRSAFAIG